MRRRLAAFGVVVVAASAPLAAGDTGAAGSAQAAPFQFGVPAPEQPFKTPVIPLDPSRQSPSDPIAPKQFPSDPMWGWKQFPSYPIWTWKRGVEETPLAMALPEGAVYCSTMRVVPLDPSVDQAIYRRSFTPQSRSRIVPKAPCVTPGVQPPPVPPTTPRQ